MFRQFGSARCRAVYSYCPLYICYCREKHVVYCKSIHATVIPVRHTVGEQQKYPYPLSNAVKPEMKKEIASPNENEISTKLG